MDDEELAASFAQAAERAVALAAERSRSAEESRELIQLRQELTQTREQLVQIQQDASGKIQALNARVATLEQDWNLIRALLTSLGGQQSNANGSQPQPSTGSGSGRRDGSEPAPRSQDGSNFSPAVMAVAAAAAAAVVSSQAPIPRSSSSRKRPRSSMPASVPNSGSGEGSSSSRSLAPPMPSPAKTLRTPRSSINLRKRNVSTAFESPFSGPNAEIARVIYNHQLQLRQPEGETNGPSSSASHLTVPGAASPRPSARSPSSCDSAQAFFEAQPVPVTSDTAENIFGDGEDGGEGERVIAAAAAAAAAAVAETGRQNEAAVDAEPGPFADVQIPIPRVLGVHDVIAQWETGDSRVGMKPLRDWTQAMINHPRWLSTYADRKRIYSAYQAVGSTVAAFEERYGKDKSLKEYKLAIQAWGKSQGFVRSRNTRDRLAPPTPSTSDAGANGTVKLDRALSREPSEMGESSTFDMDESLIDPTL